MFRRIGAAVLAVLTIATATGCAEDGTRSSAARAGPALSPLVSGPPWYDDVAPAEAGVTVGAKGTPCELPITFSLPARWVAEPVGDAAGVTLGGSRLRCEVDAKPADNVGFLRVWAVDAAPSARGPHWRSSWPSTAGSARSSTGGCGAARWTWWRPPTSSRTG